VVQRTDITKDHLCRFREDGARTESGEGTGDIFKGDAVPDPMPPVIWGIRELGRPGARGEVDACWMRST